MTKLTNIMAPTALLAAFAFATSPVAAQERGHGRQATSGQQATGQRAQPRSEQPRAEPPRAQQPRAEQPRPQAAAPPRVESRQETPRAQQPRPAETPRAQQARPVETPRAYNRGEDRRNGDNRRFEDRRDGDNRRFDDRRDGDNRRFDDHRGNEVGRAVPRRDVIVPRGGVYAPRYAPRYSPRVYGPRSFYRPYVFRPRVSIGFGIFAGYPVPYTYSYPYPVEVYGYGAPSNEVLINPGTSAYGGVALEITPADADVWVDGEYAGKVQDFDGTTQPLTLTPGTHRVEVQAPGYEPMTVDVGIQAGQVIPYRGDLRPL